MTDEFSGLANLDHWLGLDWIGEDPHLRIRAELERLLRKQVPSSQVLWLHIRNKPNFIAGGRMNPDNHDQFAASHVGFAVPFELEVRSSDGSEKLSGTFSWVAILEGARNEQVFLDIDMEISKAYDYLKLRLVELDPTRFVQTEKWIIEKPEAVSTAKVPKWMSWFKKARQ